MHLKKAPTKRKKQGFAVFRLVVLHSSAMPRLRGGVSFVIFDLYFLSMPCMRMNFCYKNISFSFLFSCYVTQQQLPINNSYSGIGVMTISFILLCCALTVFVSMPPVAILIKSPRPFFSLKQKLLGASHAEWEVLASEAFAAVR